MSHYPFWPATTAFLFAVTVWLFGRLKRNAQPLRLAMAESAERILAHPHSSESDHRLVRMYLDSAFSFRGGLLLGLVVIPYVAIVHALDVLREKAGVPRARRVRHPEVHEAVEEITEMHLRITLANHPLLCFVVFLAAVFWFGAASILVALVKGIIPSRVPPEEIAAQVEYAYARIPGRLRGYSRAAHICA